MHSQVQSGHVTLLARATKDEGAIVLSSQT